MKPKYITACPDIEAHRRYIPGHAYIINGLITHVRNI